MTRAAAGGYGPFVVAALWAFGSAQLFVRGWLAAADLVIAAVALLRGRMSRTQGTGAIAAALVTGVVCSALIRVGFWAIGAFLGYDHHGIEEIVYWACAVTFVSHLARRAPAEVRKSWHSAMNGPTPLVPPAPSAPGTP